MKTYYILFSCYNIENLADVETWVIRNTDNDMDTSKGLIQEIANIKKERGYDIFIYFWKELDINKKRKR